MVSSEQLFPFRGHIPHSATFMEIPKFMKKISYLFVDEARFISTSVTSQNDEAAHRPVYARLGSVRARLPFGTPVALFSANLPPHVLAQCTKSFHMKMESTSILLSTNRPNLAHAIILMIGNLRHFDNLEFPIPEPYHSPIPLLAKTIILIDNKIYSWQLTNHLLSRFSKDQQTSRPVRHMHADMSKAHISDACSSFKDPNGECRILVATNLLGRSGGYESNILADLREIKETLVLDLHCNPKGPQCSSCFYTGSISRLLATAAEYDGSTLARVGAMISFEHVALAVIATFLHELGHVYLRWRHPDKRAPQRIFGRRYMLKRQGEGEGGEKI